MKIILEGVVGSHAYGLATPESDVDTLGVFVLPTSTVLSLRGYQDSVVTNGAADKDVNPDRALHEVGKFLSLCLKANPTVMELLWLDEYTTLTVEGQSLVDRRDLFLSQRVRKTYVGYAASQIHRIERRGDGSFSADTRKRTAKHARHITRLLTQVETVLREGRLAVRLSADQAAFCRQMGELAATRPEEFIELATARVAEVDAIPSDLPDHPDVDTVDTVLYALRKDNM